MDNSGVPSDLTDFHLDILGQRPRINRLYTQLTFCFPIPNESTSVQSDIIETLTSGIARLSASFPWTAGKVFNEHGILKITQSEESLPLVVKDLRGEVPELSWNALQRADFPFSMLDEALVAPCGTYLTTVKPTLELHVFLVQANFINGGLLLTFNAQHGSMDMAGQSQVIYLLAKACRNEPFIPSELSVGNASRRGLVPLLEDHEQDSKLNHQVSQDIPKNPGQVAQSQPSTPKLVWAYFTFSALSLANLKFRATETAPTSSFVSTDDTLSAFVWQSVTRVRSQRLGTPCALRSTLARAVDLRHCFSIPSTYPGLVSNATFLTLTIDAVIDQTLGEIAAQLRSALDPASLRQSTSNLATLISRHENADKVGFANTSVPELDVRLSSWAKEKCYDVDFGFGHGVGKPEAVRRPRFGEGAREGLVYFLPRRLDGEIVVGICLRGEDMARLREDKEFLEFGRYIG